MKTNFDKTKVKERKFPKGDLVLAYFPIIGSPLQSRFHVNNNTYVKKSTLLIHINVRLVVMVVLAVMTVSRSMNINFLSAEEKDLEGNAQLLENICPTFQHLNPSQMKELCELLNSYQIIFGDQPVQCSLPQHKSKFDNIRIE